MPCNKNADQKLSVMTIPDWKKAKDNNDSISKYPLYSVKLVFVDRSDRVK